MNDNKTNILNLEFGELEGEIVKLGEAKFRAKQVFSWLFKGKDFSEMTNLPKALIEKLENAFYVGIPAIERVQVSKLDGTRKYLLELGDGNAIESVFMKYKFGNSLCISSQAGCRMGCKFCASTIGGLKRNLTAGELLGQILAIEKDTAEKISHIVIMGTGEPFDNYENVVKFLRIVNDEKGLNIGMRNITVSTCGIIPMIERFGNEFPQVNLAISLHNTEDSKRSELMPINKKYPMSELLDAAKKYTEKTGRRITFEYTLVDGANDTKDDALRLAKLLRGMLCHVNLIPLNVVKETGLKTTNRENALSFQGILNEKGIPATIRRELGDDIDAACGQLRLSAKEGQ